ncbi:MAG: hypothetical protein RIG26_03365, partial [Thalassospira sp.]|uniref:hypothetical protein n=1 Tax=Thalassospira sp. TaxID=1912094 RepID=UPI0032EBEB58
LRNVSHIATANHRIRIAATVGARSKWMGAKQRALAEIESLDLFTKEDVDEFERHLGMREAASVVGMALSLRNVKGALANSAKVATAEAQAAFKSSVANKPSINRQKQAGHIKGTPQHKNRQKSNKPSSIFFGQKSGDHLTQEAFSKGNPVNGRPGVKDYDFGVSVGTGPNGGMQTRVRVHQDRKGQIHGHPSGPEKF